VQLQALRGDVSTLVAEVGLLQGVATTRAEVTADERRAVLDEVAALRGQMSTVLHTLALALQDQPGKTESELYAAVAGLSKLCETTLRHCQETAGAQVAVAAKLAELQEETSVVAAALHRLRGIFQEIGIPESCGPEHQRQEVRRLLEQRAQVNLPSTHGDTPLMLAVRAAGSLGTSELPNRLAVVRELLVMRAQPDTADSEGETALMEAVCMGDLSLCGLLLEARADPERQSSAGAKAQDFCSNEELSRLLLSWSSRVTNIQGLPWERHPSAPEVFAMDADDSPRSGSFKEDDDIPTASASEAPQEMPGSSEEKLLSIAQDVGGGKTLRELLEGRADPNCRNFMQEAVLLLAVRASSQRRGQQSDAERLESVRILLHCRADPDVNDDQGETPLMEAACLGDLPICRLLLEKRASLTHASATGATALQFAQEHDDVLRCFQAMHSGFSEEEVEREQGQQEITENLKPEAFFPEWLRGADADYADPTATAATDATAKAVRPPAVRTLWELAALQDAQAIRELSFSESININQVDADGYTALHVSLFSPCLDGGKAQIDTVRCLLLVRADPNFRGGKELPLKVAAESVLPPTRLEVMRLLLEARAQAATSDEEPKPKPPKQRSSEANAEVSADLLFEAAESHAAKRLSLLTDPTLANCCDADGHSLLHRCLMAPPFDMNGQEQLVETVKALLTSRATPNKQNARGESPLLLTVRGSSSGRLKVLRQLMKANADSNLGDAQDTTPLIEAVRFGDLEVCRLLLDRGADAQLRGAHGLSAVDLAWRSSSKMREVFESQGLSPQDCTAQPEGGSVELSLRHASTQLERVISVPADASIRDVKKMFVRLTQRGSWRRLALLCDDTGRLLRDGDPLGVRRRLLVADAKAIPTEEELPEEEQWLRWTLEELQQEAQQRGLRLVHATRETLLTCLHQARSWEALSSGDLRQESMRRGLPESCDRKEVLHMLKQDLSWEHMEEVELKEDCLLQRVALPEAQETLLFVRAMRSRLRQALRWQHLDSYRLNEHLSILLFSLSFE
ncbi:unnamed protein product, partial [Durusdinium trenchii]